MRTVWLIPLMLALALVGCQDDDDNFLAGALAETLDMSVTDTRIRLFPSQLSIEYLDGDSVTLRVTIDASNAPPEQGKTYNLLDKGTFSRGPDFSELPEPEFGELTLDAFSGEDGSQVSGSFEARFVTGEGNKQGLRGAFSASLEVVDYQ
jgi:hypothetical protein